MEHEHDSDVSFAYPHQMCRVIQLGLEGFTREPLIGQQLMTIETTELDQHSAHARGRLKIAESVKHGCTSLVSKMPKRGVAGTSPCVKGQLPSPVFVDAGGLASEMFVQAQHCRRNFAQLGPSCSSQEGQIPSTRFRAAYIKTISRSLVPSTK